MKLPTFLETLPRMAYLIAIPAVAFIVTIGVVLATSGGGGDNDSGTLAAVATVKPSGANLDVAPTQAPSATPAPTVAVALNREDCAEIKGTDYQSDEERTWYLANCTGSQNVATTNTGGGGGGGGGAAVAGPPTGGGQVGGTEYALGDQLVIPSIGVNATVNGVKVPASGAMPDPKGYFYAVWYDFSAFGGIGGYTDGNLVLAAHVDCAACHNGSVGTALFWYVKDLQPGAEITYYSHGTPIKYRVRSVASYSPGTNWSGILSTSAADMTLVTCGGTWDAAAHEYSIRWAVYADKV